VIALGNRGCSVLGRLADPVDRGINIEKTIVEAILEAREAILKPYPQIWSCQI